MLPEWTCSEYEVDVVSDSLHFDQMTRWTFPWRYNMKKNLFVIYFGRNFRRGGPSPTSVLAAILPSLGHIFDIIQGTRLELWWKWQMFWVNSPWDFAACCRNASFLDVLWRVFIGSILLAKGNVSKVPVDVGNQGLPYTAVYSRNICPKKGTVFQQMSNISPFPSSVHCSKYVSGSLDGCLNDFRLRFTLYIRQIYCSKPFRMSIACDKDAAMVHLLQIHCTSGAAQVRYLVYIDYQPI